MINNAKKNTDYESLELLKKIESIIGTTINGYIQDQTTIAGGLTYIDKVTNKLFTPRLLNGATKTGTWATADSDFLPYNMTLIDGDVGKVEIITYTGTLPPRTIKANGATISRVTYAKLFSVIGTTYGAGDGVNTFKLPDLRGEFIRGWDDGRGVDSGRTLGSYQSDAIQEHRHSTGSDGKTVENPSTNYPLNGKTINGITYGNSNQVGNSGYNSQTTSRAVPETSTGTIRTAAETRSRNIALMAIIKY